MIDQIKFREIISKKIKLEDSILEKFINNSVSDLTRIKINIESLSSYEALDVLSTLTYFKEFFISKEEWEDLIYISLKNIRQGIYDNIFSPYSSFSGICYITYIVKNLLLKLPSLSTFSDSLDNLLVENIYKYLSIDKDYKDYIGKDFELIQGISGTLSYLLNFNENEKFYEPTIKLVDALIKHSQEKIIFNYKVPGWFYYPNKYEYELDPTLDSTSSYINYGISHGMCGPLTVLSLVYANGFNSSGVIQAINGIIEEYLKASYYVNDIIYWPGRISFENYIKMKNIQLSEIGECRMSWCYGSVGILRSLYISSLAISNKKIEKFTVDEMLKIAQMNISDYMLTSPIVCHGFAGTAAIMNEMYKDTKNPIFWNRTLELIEYTIESYNLHHNKNYKVDTDDEINKYDYLVGYTGILQTIYSILTGIPNGNESRILIAYN